MQRQKCSIRCHYGRVVFQWQSGSSWLHLVVQADIAYSHCWLGIELRIFWSGAVSITLNKCLILKTQYLIFLFCFVYKLCKREPTYSKSFAEVHTHSQVPSISDIPVLHRDESISTCHNFQGAKWCFTVNNQPASSRSPKMLNNYMYSTLRSFSQMSAFTIYWRMKEINAGKKQKSGVGSLTFCYYTFQQGSRWVTTVCVEPKLAPDWSTRERVAGLTPPSPEHRMRTSIGFFVYSYMIIFFSFFFLWAALVLEKHNTWLNLEGPLDSKPCAQVDFNIFFLFNFFFLCWWLDDDNHDGRTREVVVHCKQRDELMANLFLGRMWEGFVESLVGAGHWAQVAHSNWWTVLKVEENQYFFFLFFYVVHEVPSCSLCRVSDSLF